MSVRAFYESQMALPLSRRDLLRSLRHFHHSVREQDRHEVIHLLAELNDSEGDAARELIEIFEECQWRATKIEVIRALALHPLPRALEFLFRIAREEKDLPMAEAAIWSLGQTRHPLAARFLANEYRTAPETLKPALVGALGQIPDRSLAREFLKELERSIDSGKTALLRNLVLTLGELKFAAAVPVLARLAADRGRGPVALSALVSLGKTARDAQVLESLESLYTKDLFEYQIFSNALGQVRFRAQWTLEDYLQKLFGKGRIHRSLPLELNEFRAEDVLEGLKMFQGFGDFEKKLVALAGLDFKETVSWYPELFDFSKLNMAEVGAVLESLSAHYGSHLAAPLETLRCQIVERGSEELLGRWLETVFLCVPDAEKELGRLMEAGDFARWSSTLRISAINHLVNHGLVLPERARLQELGRLLGRVMDSDKDPSVQGRALRAFAQLGIKDDKTTAFAKDHLKDAVFGASVLQYFERLPQRSARQALLDQLASAPAGNSLAWLRAIGAQESLDGENKVLDSFLKTCLATGADEDSKLETLGFLARHPRPAMLDAVLAALKDERLRLSAIVALKSYAQEPLADAVAPYLKSASPSVSGRALDTLLSLPGLRPRRLVMDWFKENPTDVGVCDKLVRSFEPVAGVGEYFQEVIEGVLAKYPDHPRRDGLIDLRDRLYLKRKTAPGAEPVGPNVGEIDASLIKSVPSYIRLDDAVKSALRPAELPFVHPEMFGGSVDKAGAVLGFCKALDLYLERHLGRKQLFPRIESHLHEFQNVVHACSLNEEHPNHERVLMALGLEKFFTPDSLPVHKMTVVGKGVLSGRIVNERFKTIDGLRAWAIILLLFARKLPDSPPKALLTLKGFDDGKVAALAKRLMHLQDVRNPAAHRQNFLELASVSEVRDEVFAIMRDFETTL